MIFPLIGFFTLLGLLHAKYTNNIQREWMFKPTTSVLFILTGLTAGLDSRYGQIMFVGLVLGAIGDVLLINKAWFVAGLVSFLLGHLAYVVGLNQLVDFSLYTGDILPLEIILGLFALGVFALLNPYLGNLKIPVGIYVMVITVMVFSALAVYNTDLKLDFRRLVLVGAICFYLSDLAVAIDTFVKPNTKQAYWGLPLYYAGQFMLALSIAAL